MRSQQIPYLLLALLLLFWPVSPYVLLNPLTGRAVETPSPYWQVAQLQSANNEKVVTPDVDDNFGDNSPSTPFIIERRSGVEYLSDSGVPLYKLRQRSPYGRK